MNIQSELSSPKITWNHRDTIIICCTIVVLLCILVPNWIGARLKANVPNIKGNMRALQVAVESYATDSGGYYAGSLEDLATYFSRGGNNSGGTPSPGFKFKKIKKFQDLESIEDGDYVDISDIPKRKFDSWIGAVDESPRVNHVDGSAEKRFAAYRAIASPAIAGKVVYSSYEIIGLIYKDKKLTGQVRGIGGRALVLSN